MREYRGGWEVLRVIVKGNIVSFTFILMKAKHRPNTSNHNWEAFWHAFWVIGNLNYYCIPEDKGKFCFSEIYQSSFLQTLIVCREFVLLLAKIWWVKGIIESQRLKR